VRAKDRRELERLETMVRDGDELLPPLPSDQLEMEQDRELVEFHSLVPPTY
jgi:hypothetical protein